MMTAISAKEGPPLRIVKRVFLVALYRGGLEMRTCGAVLALAFIPVFATADDKAAKPLTPEAAAKKVNEKCTVEMVVKSTGKGSGVAFLNSKADYKDADNFTVFINKEGVAKLKEAKIEDPTAHYKNKTIRVTGTVKLYRDKPEIIVEKADQIQVVEQK
jgi:DNA/RNA endonuclease YhcR with UshA esterase domain